MPVDEGTYTVVLTVVDENDKIIKSPETLITIKSSDSRAMPLFGE
jgi:PKD repeat protein